MSKLGEYRKFLLAALAAAIVALQAALSDGWPLTGDEWWQIALAALAALGVVLVPNRAPEPPPLQEWPMT